MKHIPRNIFIISGEASGDIQGGHLAAELKKQAPQTTLTGIGGPQMQAAGVELYMDQRSLAVAGFTEVFHALPRLAGLYFRLKKKFRTAPPDLLVLIDYPEFNLQIARMAKKAGIKVLYYISPQIWAWRRGRVKTIARRIERMLVILPFEEEFYRRHGVEVHFVGHPLLDAVKPRRGKAIVRRELGLKPASTVIGLLPGSRMSEVTAHLTELLGAARKLHERFPDLEFVIPIASTVNAEAIRREVKASGLPIVLAENYFHDVLQLCRFVLMSSGSATLEAAILGVPMVIMYKVSRLTYLFARLFVKVDCIGLVNVIAGRKIAPELIQDEATAENLASAAERLLTDRAYYKSLRRELSAVKQKLGKKGAAARAAALTLELLT